MEQQRDFGLLELNAFIAVVEAEGLHGAAQVIGRTESAVCLQIRRLEAALKVALFRKEGRRLVLTAAGQRMLERARQIVSLQNELRAALARSTVPHGTRPAVAAMSAR